MEAQVAIKTMVFVPRGQVADFGEVLREVLIDRDFDFQPIFTAYSLEEKYGWSLDMALLVVNRIRASVPYPDSVV